MKLVHWQEKSFETTDKPEIKITRIRPSGAAITLMIDGVAKSGTAVSWNTEEISKGVNLLLEDFYNERT